MIHEKMEKALNAQVNAEYWSAYLYLSMSAWFENINLPGFANWMYMQAQEESSHAIKMFKYIVERGGVVKLQPIDKVETEWEDVITVFEETLAHEQKVTGLINNLMDIAIDIKDHASKSFLQWFIDEQVEEESSVDAIIHQLKMVKNSPHALFMLDKEFAGRVFTPSV